MRPVLALFVLATLAGCPASHKRKNRNTPRDADAAALDASDEEEPDDDDATPDDIDAEGDAPSHTDASPADDSVTDAEPDAGTVRAQLLSPAPAAEYYAFEDVPLRGECRGLPESQAPSARFVATGAGPDWQLQGAAGSHRFEQPGSYTIELTCRADSGEEQRAKVELTIHPTPQIAYAATAAGAQNEAVFAARLDQLGQATRISPASEAFAAKISEVRYSPTSDRMIVRGNLFDRRQDVLALLTPCRAAACAGQEVSFEALVPEAHACAIGQYTFAPDGRSIFASYKCSAGSGGATSYWVDLSGATPLVTSLGSTASPASGDGSGDFAAGSDVLVFQAGAELKAMDTRAPQHPVVSLGSVADARWLVSPARDRVLVLGAQGFVLNASELMTEGAGARRPLAYDRGAPLALRPSATHLIYILRHSAANGQVDDEYRLMRWDGSRDEQLCSKNCAAVQCGDHVMLSLWDEPSYMWRIASGASSDLAEKIPFPADAPPPQSRGSFNSDCTLVSYFSGQSPNSNVVWDTNTAEWLAVSAELAPDGRHLLTGESLQPLARAPLRVLPPVAAWTSGQRGTFTRDGKYYAFHGTVGTEDGTYLLDLQTYRSDRIGDLGFAGFSPDESRLLLLSRDFDQRLTEYELPSRALSWRSARGTADWGSLYHYWDVRMVPGARAVAYRGSLGTDGALRVYRSDLEHGTAQQFGEATDNWEISPDGKLLGTSNWQELALWSFDAQGATTPRAYRRLDRSMSCLTFEVGADGLLCVGRGVGVAHWLDAKSGAVADLTLARTTETYWRGTRGPAGAPRGMLLYITDDDYASASWLSFANPAAPQIEGEPEERQWWMLTHDNHYLLRGGTRATNVTDLATGITRTLTKASMNVYIPSPYQYHDHFEDGGRMVMSNGSVVYWVDLDAALVTSSVVLNGDNSLLRLGSDLSRVLVLNRSRSRLELVTDTGQHTTLYQDDVNTIMQVFPSASGRVVALTTDASTFLVATDGASPATRVSAAVDMPRLDRTGRFMLGILTKQPDVDALPVLKVWKLDEPSSSMNVAPPELAPFGHYSAVWVP